MENIEGIEFLMGVVLLAPSFRIYDVMSVLAIEQIQIGFVVDSAKEIAARSSSSIHESGVRAQWENLNWEVAVG